MLCFDYANPSTHIAATMNHERAIHTHALSNTLSLSHSHTHTHTHTLSNSLSLSLSLSLSVSLSLTHTHTRKRAAGACSVRGPPPTCPAAACPPLPNRTASRQLLSRTAPLRVSTLPCVSMLSKLQRSACPPLPNRTSPRQHLSIRQHIRKNTPFRMPTPAKPHPSASPCFDDAPGVTLYGKGIESKLSGNEVYDTACSLPVILNKEFA